MCRYEEAARLFRTSQLAFPRPTLIFQVLLLSDPRLATATKYHAVNAQDPRKRIMTVVEYKLKEKEKKRSEESLQEITKYLAAYRAKLAAATPTPVTIYPQDTSSPSSLTPLIDHPYDPVQPSANVSRGTSTSSAARNDMSISHLFPDLEDVMKASRASSMRRSTGSLNASRSAGSTTPTVQSPSVAEPRAQSPQAAPPNIANLFSTAAQATTAATSTLSSELRSTAMRASNELRTNAIIQGATLTNEIKGVLEGFLDHLGGQLATFEDGMREKLDLAGRTTGSAAAMASEGHVRRESELDLRHMPGAFQTSTSVEATTQPATPAKEIHEEELVAYKHQNKICDSCGKTPAGVCFKCNVRIGDINGLSTSRLTLPSHQ